MTLIDATQSDQTDPLRHFRDRFELPQGVIYLDGNSLGALPKTVKARVARTISEEWGEQLIRSWNTAGWVHLPQQVGGKIGRLIGAQDGCVVAADSTSINLFKVLSAALSLNPDRTGIVSERENFPTDLYIAQGVAKQIGQGHQLALAGKPGDIPAMLTSDVAVLMLTHVNYRTGYRHDMAAITKAAHDKGILVIWDLAHSAGAMAIDLAGADADFAIGCGYKYLNGGPARQRFFTLIHVITAVFASRCPAGLVIVRRSSLKQPMRHQMVLSNISAARRKSLAWSPWMKRLPFGKTLTWLHCAPNP